MRFETRCGKPRKKVGQKMSTSCVSSCTRFALAVPVASQLQFSRRSFLLIFGSTRTRGAAARFGRVDVAMVVVAAVDVDATIERALNVAAELAATLVVSLRSPMASGCVRAESAGGDGIATALFAATSVTTRRARRRFTIARSGERVNVEATRSSSTGGGSAPANAVGGLGLASATSKVESSLMSARSSIARLT